MTKSVWMRCVLVSLLMAAITPPLTSTIMVSPEDGEMVPDLATIDSNELEGMSSKELEERVNEIPMRKVEGIERFTYQFTHPQYFHFYIGGVLSFFPLYLLATILVSYGHVRNDRAA